MTRAIGGWFGNPKMPWFCRLVPAPWRLFTTWTAVHDAFPDDFEWRVIEIGPVHFERLVIRPAPEGDADER